MKKIVTKYFLSLIGLFGISIGLMGAPVSRLSINSNLNPINVEDFDIILKTPFTSKNNDFVSSVSKLSLNTLDNSEDVFNTQVYEIKSNNYVQLVAEPYLGYLFSHWSIDGKSVSENIVYEFLMPEKDVLVSANYIQVPVPSVEINSPIGNSVYTTSDIISVDIEAISTLGQVEKVELFINENLVYTAFELPYKYELKNYSEGEYNLRAVATDNTGQFSTSKVSTIIIQKSNVAPVISISSPNSNAQFILGDNANITATATDADGTVTKVEFYNGTTLLGTDTTSPYSIAWTNLPVGNFTLTAKATDDKGTATVSGVVNINVVEKANVAPTVSITAPNANAQFTQGDNANITATAADADGTVTKVEFYNGTTLLGTDTTSPYSVAWTNLPVGNFTLTAKATDNKGTATVSAEVNINVVEKVNEAQVESFTLINAVTNQEMFNLTSGMQIEGNILSNLKVNIRANTNPSVVGSVYFTLTGPVNLTRLENAAPYALNGDNNGVYFGMDLPVGTYDLTAVTYSGSNRGGTKGPIRTITFSILDTPNEAPTVSITAPNSNAQFTQGDNANITATAADADGTVTKVEFYNETTLLGTDTTSPYSFAWTNLPVGNFTLTAKATDNKGTATVSGQVNINVVEKANVAPTVSITAPNANAQFTQGDNANIAATAADADGTVTKVEFYNGTTLLGTDTTSPYSIAWTNLPVGNFTLTAKATDNKGIATVSAAVSINVSEVIQDPIEVVIPEIIIVTPVNNQEFDANENVELMVMFQGSDETVKKVEYYSGNQLIGSSNISPFGFTWSSPAVTQHTITAKAIGEDPSNFKISESVSILIKEKIPQIFQILDPIKDAVFIARDDVSIKVEIPVNNKPINRIDYFRGNIRIGSSTKAPYDFVWTNARQGNHDLTAQLVYSDGTKIATDAVPIKVLKRNQAAVKLVSPNNKREVKSGENLDLKVELLEFEDKVDFVEYLLNGELLGASETQPYVFQWKNIPEGDHKLVARAIDSKGLVVYSDPMTLSARKEVSGVRLDYVIGPNPTTEFLNVIFTNLDTVYDLELRVISMDGIVQKTFNGRSEDSTVTVDVSDLKNGVYVLQLIANGNNISSKRFIKK
ncbi:MAG: Ig-like domain-containing protein [Algoriphagus sp.]|uniref:Ig-like domain-containing protein n=1 Tax=Algoriphagus sp. TaxID=1872435 RepID=UPI00262596BE|nr:Ig-like domain-containing protein [Algoriphagus sp.]MDG1277467.1 Ig-like domain-containing protein [Algoriphagus sp.]